LDELPNSSCYWALPGELLIVAGDLRLHCGFATYGFCRHRCHQRCFSSGAIVDLSAFVELSTYFVTVVVTPLLLSIADVAVFSGSCDTFGLFILLP
jgi:hypothetical protein